MEDDERPDGGKSDTHVSWRAWLLFWLVILGYILLLVYTLDHPCVPEPGRDCETPGYDEIYILYAP